MKIEAVFRPRPKKGHFAYGKALWLSLFGIANTVLTAAALADYRVELDVNYGEVRGLPTDPESANVGVAVFLAPVQDSKGPRAEAEFLSRASSLRYTYNRSESATPAFGIPGVAVTEPRLTDNNHSLAARYVFPDNGWANGLANGWIVSLAGNVLDADDVSVAGSFDTDTQSYGVTAGVGRYLDDTTTVEVFLGYNEFNGDTTTLLDCLAFGVVDPNCENLGVGNDFDTESFSISALFRRVGRIGTAVFSTSASLGYTNFDLTNRGPAISVIGDVDPTAVDTLLPLFESVTTSDSNDSFSAQLAGTWYPISDLGVDLNYTFESAGPADGHTIGTAVGWFVTPSIELRGSYEVTFFDGSAFGVGGSSDESRVWRATLRARF